ncbi:dienelactone hydrolase family protein [Salinisphaera hydrothermalis]|uniref:Dienelactone hydrolase n=1 Tax=Salinisphaera hydrothermalis (strain C41B8) TaxID=1304275 RepID=A0A084IN92_SALHC|nr:alpha/beta fold hydrolase [Salinisphaera hydrothermalis]KEZ78176.1 dienelactone hydrolase [Salinisphaera hydrothermalis C41B8]
MTSTPAVRSAETAVRITRQGISLSADVIRPAVGLRGTILFAHGSGSSRLSPRNRWVAARLVDAGFATVLLDLLTPTEDRVDQRTREFRFDIPLLAERLEWATNWLRKQHGIGELPVGYFGASTGAAAALIAAARQGERISAVVSRGGRPDLAHGHLAAVHAPTLLIVGAQDPEVLELNQTAARHMPGLVKIEIVPGATHLFEEPGALETVSDLARDWFRQYMV